MCIWLKAIALSFMALLNGTIAVAGNCMEIQSSVIQDQILNASHPFFAAIDQVGDPENGIETYKTLSTFEYSQCGDFYSLKVEPKNLDDGIIRSGTTWKLSLTRETLRIESIFADGQRVPLSFFAIE